MKNRTIWLVKRIRVFYLAKLYFGAIVSVEVQLLDGAGVKDQILIIVQRNGMMSRDVLCCVMINNDVLRSQFSSIIERVFDVRVCSSFSFVFSYFLRFTRTLFSTKQLNQLYFRMEFRNTKFVRVIIGNDVKFQIKNIQLLEFKFFFALIIIFKFILNLQQFPL